VKRVDRLLELLVVLQVKKLVTVDYLSQKFHVSTRTVYRDIQALTGLQLAVKYDAEKGVISVAALSKTGSSQSMIIFPAAVKK
jgi:predicted DNA-binding transcriptional regulator YafY